MLDWFRRYVRREARQNLRRRARKARALYPASITVAMSNLEAAHDILKKDVDGSMAARRVRIQMAKAAISAAYEALDRAETAYNPTGD